MSEHRREVSSQLSSGAGARPWARLAGAMLAAAALIGAIRLATSSEQTALRGAPGPVPEVPPLRVEPVPTLDANPPGWRRPEEEHLPERRRERQPLAPESLAGRPAPPQSEARAAPIPPLQGSPEPAEAPAPGALRLARADLPDLPVDLPDLLGAPHTAPHAHHPALAASAEVAQRPSDADAAPGPTATPAKPPRTPAPQPLPDAPDVEDLLVAPEGAGPVGRFDRGAPIGTSAKGVPAPLPKLTPERKGPSIVIDRPEPDPAILGVPANDPGPGLRPEAPPTPAPSTGTATPGLPGVGSREAPGLPGVGSREAPGVVVKDEGPVSGRARVPAMAQRTAVPVPEPGTLLLVAAGLALLGGRRPRR